jgi:hypothetical protein
VHDTELERGGLVGEQHGDPGEWHTGDDGTSGRKFATHVVSATRGGNSTSAGLLP